MKTSTEDETEPGSETSVDSTDTDEQKKAAAFFVKQDMKKLEKIFEAKGMQYKLLERIGEVYKAEDRGYDLYDDKSVCVMISLMTRYPDPSNDTTHFVAVKKIYVTSSPVRIQNELQLLHRLRGIPSICSLITAFRHQDQVVAVLPYFPHQDFRLYYQKLSIDEIRDYLRILLFAVAAVHAKGIIHRDIKPTNFLYDPKTRRGVLVDFGLAEYENIDSVNCLCQESAMVRRSKRHSSLAHNPEGSVGYPKNDSRPSRRANRAGTRGFRAPEVLLKCTAQTTKIDVWSVGVILLCLLTQRFPFFNSTDDADALIEVSTLFGKTQMKTCASLHGTVFECTLKTVVDKGHSMQRLIEWSRSIAKDQLPDGDRQAIAFLHDLMELDFRQRISAADALKHPFLGTIEDDAVDLVADS